jgi:hypothetical protein
VLASGDDSLIRVWKKVLQTVAKNQSDLGHIPSLIHDPEDRGASDTTPLFLMAVGLFRQETGEDDFLADAVSKSLNWMEYQSPTSRVMVGQLPTTDWRDEHWVLGYGLYVNAIVYTYLKLLQYNQRAQKLKEDIQYFTFSDETEHRHVHEGLMLRKKPYFALWSFKTAHNERFDLLGNSLAALCGLASPSRSGAIVSWIERECQALRDAELLGVPLSPCLFPYIRPAHPDWRPRYAKYNQPGEYHNGGIWPFISGFHISAIVASGRYKLAEAKLLALTKLVAMSRNQELQFGFNEWHQAQDGTPKGQDWQTWSAAMYLYAAKCVEERNPLYFEFLRAPEETPGKF